MQTQAATFTNSFYSLTVGAQRSVVSELFQQEQRARWLDGWGQENVPGLSFQVKARPSNHGVFESVVLVTYAQLLTPERFERAAGDKLRLYHEMLRWDRALHYYLATGQRIPSELARDAGQYQFPPFADADAIAAIVADYEAALLPSGLWKHEQHLAVIVWYLLHYSLEEAHERFRTHSQQVYQRYQALNPYHETITCFWLRWVNACLNCIGRDQPIIEIVNHIIRACSGSNIIFHYYNRHRLFSDLARQTFVEPDLAPFDFEPMPKLPVNEGYRPFVVPIQVVQTDEPLVAQMIYMSLDDGSKNSSTPNLSAVISPAAIRDHRRAKSS